MRTLFKLGFLALGLLSFSGHFGTLHPHLDMLAHFKLQFCLALLAGIALLWLLQSRVVLRLGLLLLLANALELLPWYVRLNAWPGTEAHADNLQKPERLKLMLANVLFANHDARPLQKLIETEQPDLVVLQEANQDLLQMMAGFRNQLPFHFRTRKLPYGLAVWSRYPIAAPGFELLGEGELPVLSGQLQLARGKVGLFTTHLTSPVRRPAIERNRQLLAVADFLQHHRETDLVLGDFNVSMWSPYYQRLERVSGFGNCRRGFGVLPSWPAQLPGLARIPIDQCLHGPRLRTLSMRSGPNIGSDHLPLLMEVEVKAH